MDVIKAGLTLMGLGMGGVFLVLGLFWGSIAVLRFLLPGKADDAK